METSAKTDEGVQDLMENIFEKILVEKLKALAAQEQAPPVPENKQSFPLK